MVSKVKISCRYKKKVNLYFPQIVQIFFMIKLSRVFVIPKEYKRKYDFDKIKNLSLIAQIAQIFF